jgi:hypothetical protein
LTKDPEGLFFGSPVTTHFVFCHSIWNTDNANLIIKIITYRRSTLLACDRVHVLSRGRVVESGDPSVLIRAGQSGKDPWPWHQHFMSSIISFVTCMSLWYVYKTKCRLSPPSIGVNGINITNTLLLTNGYIHTINDHPKRHAGGLVHPSK